MTVRTWMIFGAVAVVGVVGIALVRQGGEESNRIVTEVVRGPLEREVSVAGVVVAGNDASLSFGVSGTVASIIYDVGDTVPSGAVIARLRNTSKIAERDEASASLQAAQAELDKLKKGASAEDRLLADAKLEKANVSLDEARSVLVRELRESLTVAEDTLFNKVDPVFSNPRSFPQLKVPGVSPQLKATIEADRRTYESTLDVWRSIVLNTSPDTVIEKSDALVDNISSLVSFLTNVANALAGATASGETNDTVITGWQSDVALGRTNIDVSRDAISDAIESLASAEAAREVAIRERDVAYADPTIEELAVYTARVSEARARLDRINAAIEDTLLRAPFTGVLGKSTLSIGENVTALEQVAVLESSGSLFIEAYVPEVDIALLETGLDAHLTLDALDSSDVFMATVEHIDQTATVREGVATYKVQLRLADVDPRIRTGMSANTDILVAQKDDVLTIPGRALIREGAGYYVRVLDGDQVRNVDVRIGLRGTFGDVEILEGLSQGDIVVVREE